MGSIARLPGIQGFRISVIACLLLIPANLSRASENAAGREVELRLKIQSDPGKGRYKEWDVALRKSSGAWVQRTKATAGDKLHFRRLKPDIYVVCVFGSSGRERCVSIDMIPPQDNKNHVFALEIATPDPMLNSVNRHTVHVRQLEIPGGAKRELQYSEEAGFAGDQEGMIRHLKRAIEIAPHYAQALNNLGAHYHRAGDHALSVEFLTEAVQLDPDLHLGWSNLAGSLIALHRWEEALDAALRGVALRPDNAFSNSQAGLSHYYLGQYKQAEKYFRRVLELDPSYSSFPMLFLAHLALRDGRKASAADYIRLFLALHPYSPEAPYWTGFLESLVSGTVSESPVTPSQ